MFKNILKFSLAVVVVAIGLFGIDKVSAAICLVQNGCTGTGQIPTNGQVLIGNSSGTYTPGTVAGGSSTIITAGNAFLLVNQTGVNATLTPLSVLSLTSSSDISFSAPTGTNITATFLNPHGFTTTTIQSVLNSLSGTGLITYNSSTGVFNATNTGNWAGTWQGVNSSTFYLASNPSAYISNITGLINSTGTNITVSGLGTIASPFIINATGGTGFSTTTPYVNGNLTLASGTALSTFSGSLCGGSTFQNGISASGTALCGTPSGGSSSTNVFGTNGVTTTQTGVNATASLDTTYAASWSALETFLKGATINGTTTLASTTNAILLTNGSGTVAAYTGTTCGGGQAPNGFSATGTFTGCVTFLTGNQTITLTGAITGSGATTIATTFTTSTLYNLFSGTSPITFSTSTGAIGCATCLTGNQSITWTGTGDVTGSGSGATSISVALTTVKIQGKNVTSTAPTDHQVLTYINANSDYEPANFTVATPLTVATATGSSTSFIFGCSSCVTGITAGTAISVVPSAGSFSISNAGVYSFNGQTGTTTLNVTSPLVMATSSASTTLSCPTCSTTTNPGTVTTSSAVTTKYFPTWGTASALTGTSTLYQPSANDITIGSTSDNGLFSIVNASNTTVLKISTTTNQTSSAVLLDLQATSSVFQVLASGHINATGTAPTMGTCGTSPSVIGNDAMGTITIGSGVVTACTMNFAIPYESSNITVLESDNSTAVTGDVSAISTSSVTFSFSATLGGGKLYYWIGQNL